MSWVVQWGYKKGFFLFDSKYKEYKDIGILYLSVSNVSMLQWYTYKLWTVMRLCLFNNCLVCSFSYCSWPSICSSTGLTLQQVLNLLRYFSLFPKRMRIHLFLILKRDQSFDSGTPPQEVIP